MAEQLDAFALAAAGKERAAGRRRGEIERLVPLARDLAHRAPEGVTVANLRVAGAQRGLLPNVGRGRELSFLGAVMRAAGLRTTGEYRRNHVPESHGNLLAVWRLPAGDEHL